MGCSCGDKCLNKGKYSSNLCYDGGKAEDCDLGFVPEGGMMPLNDLLLNMMNRMCIVAQDGADGADGPPGPPGADGVPGDDGTQLIQANGVPSDAAFDNGDSYIDLFTNDLYYKSNNSWVLTGNLNGDDGADGLDGNDVYDSGWKTMNNYSGTKGFGVPNLNYGVTQPPSIRVVGRVVFLEGFITLPLADGGGNLLPNVDQYMNTHRFESGLYSGGGVNGGFYSAPPGNSFGSFNSYSPILPLHLRPNSTHYVAPARTCFRRSTDKTPDGTGKFKSLVLTTQIVNSLILPDGKLYFNTYANIADSAYFSTNSPILNNGLIPLIDRVDADDFVISYNNYKTSFTGATDNRVSSVTTSQYPATFDGLDPNTLGGLAIDISTSYPIDESFTIQQIQDAFDSI